MREKRGVSLPYRGRKKRKTDPFLSRKKKKGKIAERKKGPLGYTSKKKGTFGVSGRGKERKEKDRRSARMTRMRGEKKKGKGCVPHKKEKRNRQEGKGA